nr:hypothetical protein CFP56_60912 [Quercus suber]
MEENCKSVMEVERSAQIGDDGGAKLELSFGRAINRDTRSTPTVTLHAHPCQSQDFKNLILFICGGIGYYGR